MHVHKAFYRMSYTCPYCEKDFPVAELQMPAGPSGGTYCPRCGERVHLFFPYGRLVIMASLLIAIGAMAVFRVRSVVVFASGTMLIWVPLSQYLKFASVRYGPPTLKRWTERRRTLFEWRYERNAPRDI